MNTDFQEVITIPVNVDDDENLIERVGTRVPVNSIVDGSVKYFLARKIDEEYLIIGFSDESVKDLTDLKEIKHVFASEFVKAREFAKEYRREHKAWGHWGLYQDVEYWEYLAEQCHYLLTHELEETTIHYWREKAHFMQFTKNDFFGGSPYVNYLPIQHVDVDGVDIVFDPNDIVQKAKKNGVVYQSVDEMLAFANAGDLAYSEGGVAHE